VTGATTTGTTLADLSSDVDGLECGAAPAAGDCTTIVVIALSAHTTRNMVDEDEVNFISVAVNIITMQFVRLATNRIVVDCEN
jgi:hypothetical protein